MQAWLLHLNPIVVRKLVHAGVNQMACTCRFLFGTVRRRALDRFDVPAKGPEFLPRVLSRDDVSSRFEAAANLRARTLLMATYAAGLRVSEVCAPRLANIESAPDRLHDTHNEPHYQDAEGHSRDRFWIFERSSNSRIGQL